MKIITILFCFFMVAKVCSQEQEYQSIELTKEQIEYLNENPDIKKNIDEYLEQSNPLTDENKKFAKDLVALLCEMDYKTPVYTEEDYPGKEDGLLFEWWK